MSSTTKKDVELRNFQGERESDPSTTIVSDGVRVAEVPENGVAGPAENRDCFGRVMMAALPPSPAGGGSSRNMDLVQHRRDHVIAHSRRFDELTPKGMLSWQECWESTRDYFECSVSAIPIVQWLPTVTLQTVGQDGVAGLTVGVLLIPQSMAYAALAGLPPLYGLYSSTVPLFVYALLASSTKLSPGPVAPVSILINQIVSRFDVEDMDDRIQISVALAFVSGVVLMVAGFLRLGFIASLLSWPVMSGFVSAAAFIIIASQLDAFFGLETPRVNEFYLNVYHAFANIHTTNLVTFAISLVSLVILVGFKYMHRCYLWPCTNNERPPPRWVPIQLLVVAGAVLLSWGLKLDEVAGVRVVGDIPAQFPTPKYPLRDGAQFFELLPQAMVLSLVAYVGSISLAVAFAKDEQEEVSSSVELGAQGAASFVGAFFSSFTPSGSFTRTAVNAEMGAKTPMAVMITGLLMLLVLLVAAPLFEKLPQAVLAAMVIASTQSLLKYKDAAVMYRTKPADLLQLVGTFILTLALGIDTGIMVSVGLSLVLLIYRSFQPRVTELGRLPGTDVFVDAKRYPQTRRVKGVIVLRVDGELNFGNNKIVSHVLMDILTAIRMRRLQAFGTATVAAGIARQSTAPPTMDHSAPDVENNFEGGRHESDNLAAKHQKTDHFERGHHGTDSFSANPDKTSTNDEEVPDETPKHTEMDSKAVVDDDEEEGYDDKNVSDAVDSPAVSRDGAAHSQTSEVIDSVLPSAARQRHRTMSANARHNIWTSRTTSVPMMERDWRKEYRYKVPRKPESTTQVVYDADITAATADHHPLPPVVPRSASPDGAIAPEEMVPGAGLDPSILAELPPAPAGGEWFQDPLGIRAVVIDGGRITSIDTSACQELQTVIAAYEKLDVELLFASFPGPVRDTMDRFGTRRNSETETVYLTVTAAIESVLSRGVVWRAGTNARGNYYDHLLPSFTTA